MKCYSILIVDLLMVTLENTGFDFQKNNAWSVHMHLRTSRISRPSLVGQKPV